MSSLQTNNRQSILDRVLLNIEGHNWTIADSCEGTVCFGATGSGKTSGPLRLVAESFLKNGFGGIVFCYKSNEKKGWEKLCKSNNRLEDIIYLSKQEFNFLNYELRREGEGSGQTENIVNMLLEVVEIGKDKSKQGGTTDEYWRNAVKQLLRNIITILNHSNELLTLENIKRIIISAPIKDSLPQGTENYFNEIQEKCIDNGDIELKMGFEFFNSEFANLDNRTRSNVISSLSVIADSLLRGELKRCFCTGTTLKLEEIYTSGKILVVDYAVQEWNKIGQYAAAIMKYCFQKMIEKRTDTASDYPPVFLFADEAQAFLIDNDCLFQSTARSSRVATVYATQNIGNLRIGYGRERTSSILGNLGTKVFCQNGDPETNKWASESIGKSLLRRRSRNINNIKYSKTEGWSEQKDFVVDTIDFTDLPKGGIRNRCRVGFIFWQSGIKLEYNRIYIASTVQQICNKLCGTKKVNRCKSNKNAGEGAFFGKKENVLFSDILIFGILLLTGISAYKGYLDMYYGLDRLLFAVAGIIHIDISFFYILPAGVFFIALINLVVRVYLIIYCLITKQPRKVVHKEKVFLRTEVVLIYSVLSVLLDLMLIDYFFERDMDACIIIIFCWGLSAFLLKMFLYSEKKEVKKRNILN